MERPKNFIRLLTFFFLMSVSLSFLNAQNTYQKIVYNAYISGDMQKWAAVINTMEKNGEYKTLGQKLELISYYYGYIGYALGLKNYDQAEKLLSKAEKHIAAALAQSPKISTANAYKGSFIGFRIALSKFKAITLGPESASYINKAFESDKSNIQAVVDRANSYFYTPALFGGNKTEAIKLYNQGIKLFESTGTAEHNWFYLSVLTTLARAYEKVNKTNEALAVYKKILQIEPEFSWVKKELYPALLKKSGK